jgi:hypothetical protein
MAMGEIGQILRPPGGEAVGRANGRCGHAPSLMRRRRPVHRDKVAASFARANLRRPEIG